MLVVTLFLGRGVDIRQRFWAKVAQKGPDDCWPWKEGTNRHGYGRFNTGRVLGKTKIELAHRLAFTFATGSAPLGVVRHSCHNPPCCNPAHLSDGTAQDNANDMVAAGRQAREFALPHTKLSDADVLLIKNSQDRGVDLAHAFGVSQSTICDVRKGRRV